MQPNKQRRSLDYVLLSPKVTKCWLVFLLAGEELQLILDSRIRLSSKLSATTAYILVNDPVRDELQGPAPQIVFLGTITSHCSFRVPTPTTLFEAVSVCLPVLKLQPDDALLWLCISEFLLFLPIPDNPSDAYYGLSPSVFPSPLPPKPSRALMFLLTHLVPVLLQEEKSLHSEGCRQDLGQKSSPRFREMISFQKHHSHVSYPLSL